MFGSSFKLFKIFGIEIRLDFSWFIVFALFAYYFGFNYFPAVLPDVNGGIIAVITIITVILFFSSVLIHEISHSLVAKSKGTPVEKITLFLFGGMAQIEKEPETPMSEFVMAIAGPAASFVLAIFFGVICLLTGQYELIREPVRYLTIINVLLGVFNMLPGYPLDGGRVPQLDHLVMIHKFFQACGHFRSMVGNARNHLEGGFSVQHQRRLPKFLQ